jgi:hypothetical protein
LIPEIDLSDKHAEKQYCLHLSLGAFKKGSKPTPRRAQAGEVKARLVIAKRFSGVDAPLISHETEVPSPP